MHTYAFTLIIEGADLMDADVLDKLFEAGCDDAGFGRSQGVSSGYFDREAPDLQTAIATATRAVESVKPLHVVRVEIDDEALVLLGAR